MDRLDAMQAFVRVIEKGSFSAVAKERRIGQPAVSKRTAAVEEDLGTELIYRTSLSIALTEAGRDSGEVLFLIYSDEGLSPLQPIHIASLFLYGMDSILPEKDSSIAGAFPL